MVNQKYMAIPSESESTPQYKKQMLHEHKASKAWYPIYTFLAIKQDAPSVHLWVFMQALQEQHARTLLLSSTTSYWGYLPPTCYETSFQSCWKMWICRKGSIYAPFMIVLHHIFLLQFKNSWTTCFWQNV